jgi:glyoxylase-like metal-dependent hydrolase (beta-lactamase superfamily II)/ferredoxin
MARLAERLPENVDGDLFVDAQCIDCDTCRELAPSTFARADRGLSYVARQPRSGAERLRALQALVSCPVAAIGLQDSASLRPPLGEASRVPRQTKADVRAAARSLPVEIADGIYACGWASADSYGAQAYLIRRPAGNVLVDSPRAARPLLRRLEELGGVATMFLSHRDDVADHAVFARRFGCRRVLHADDASAGTRDVELLLRGREPVRLDGELVAIPVPGHTRGSTALLYKDVLFTGDHLWWDADEGGLDASRSVCWHSWSEQKQSLRRLLDFSFRAVLPGHGGRHIAADAHAMRAALEKLVARLG